MRGAAKSPRLSQLQLFHPTIMAPNWEHLPREMREQTVRLRARLENDASSADSPWAMAERHRDPGETSLSAFPVSRPDGALA